MQASTRRPRLGILALLLSLLAPVPAAVAAEAGGAGRAADRQAEEQRIRELDRQWVAAAAAKDVATVVDLYAPDGVLMPPNAPAAEGRDAIARFWTELVALPGLSLTFGPAKIEVSQAGDVAYETGTYSVTFDSPQGRKQDKGKYVVVWRKVDGEWKVAADIFNSDLPAP